MKPEGQDWESLWKRGKVATSLRRLFCFLRSRLGMQWSECSLNESNKFPIPIHFTVDYVCVRWYDRITQFHMQI